MKFSKKIVTLIVMLNVMFTVGVLVVFWHTGNEPTELVRMWFLSFTAELWLISGIKKRKLEKEMYNGLNEKTDL